MRIASLHSSMLISDRRTQADLGFVRHSPMRKARCARSGSSGIPTWATIAMEGALRSTRW